MARQVAELGQGVQAEWLAWQLSMPLGKPTNLRAHSFSSPPSQVSESYLLQFFLIPSTSVSSFLVVHTLLHIQSGRAFPLRFIHRISLCRLALILS